MGRGKYWAAIQLQQRFQPNPSALRLFCRPLKLSQIEAIIVGSLPSHDWEDGDWSGDTLQGCKLASRACQDEFSLLWALSPKLWILGFLVLYLLSPHFFLHTIFTTAITVIFPKY